VPEKHDEDLATRGVQPVDYSIDIDAWINRFVIAVDAEIEERLTDEVVEARLEQVRRDTAWSWPGSPEWSLDNPTWRGLVQDLAMYGNRVVQIWLRIILVWFEAVSAPGGTRVDLTDDDIEELTRETVARAINSFRDEARRSEQRPADDAVELRTTFLTQCARQLPHAYRSRLLKTGRLAVDRLDEELAERPIELVIVRALRHCVTDWRHPTNHLLRAWGLTDHESEEVVSMTVQVLDFSAQRYPKTAGPENSVGPSDNQEVER